jgi:hypothetical protein
VKRANIVASLLLVAFACFYAYLTSRLPERNLPNTLGSDFMPWLLTTVLFFLSFWLLLQNSLRGTIENFNPDISIKEGLGIVFLTIFVYVYVKAIQFFGFIVITPVFLAILMWISGSRKWKEIVTVSIGSSFCIYLFFQKIFRVILPGGTIF